MTRLLLLLLLLLAVPAAAQPVELHAFVDRTVIGDAEALVYTVEVRGPFRDLDRVDDPVTRNLVATQARPTQQLRVLQRDGQTTRELTLQWQFRPSRAGDAEVGPTVLILDGRRYVVDQIAVRVVPQAQRPPPAAPAPPPAAEPDPGDAERLFLTARPDRRTVYVGQQVIVDYVLHFAHDVQPRNARIGRPWDAPGFWREDLDLGTTPPAEGLVIGGVPVTAATVKRAALFPTRAGALSVDPFVVDLDVLRAHRPGGASGPFYNPFGSRFRRESVTAPAFPVTVRPLPSGAPPEFAGAVGAFSLHVDADRRPVQAGEPLRVTVTLRGDGNLALLDAPVWALPPPFEVFPPREETAYVRTGERLRGERRFTYAVTAARGGRFELPPVRWAYFDPASQAYRTLTSQPIAIEVLGGAGPPEAAAPVRPAPVFAVEPGTWRRVRAARPFYASPLVLGGFAAPLLALLGLVLLRRFRDHEEEASPLERRLRAFPDAEAALREAEAHRARGDLRAFHAAVEQAVRRFLRDRLDLGSRSPGADEVEALLARRGVSEVTRADLREVFERCRQGQYAPVPPPVRPGATDAVARVLTSVDAEAEGAA